MHAFSVADGYWASTNHMVNNEKKSHDNVPTPRVPTKIPTILASFAFSTK